MTPHVKRSLRDCRTARTAVDAKLMERTGLDEFSLRRLRREFMVRSQRMSHAERRALADGGTCPRFCFMVGILHSLWTEERWLSWLHYLEHTQRDLDEMCRGEYPISPYMVRVFSALFGIKVDYLLLGSAPSVDRHGADIDVWPMTGIR